MNKYAQETLIYFTGILGGLTILYGITQTSPTFYFVFGSACLLVTALYHKLTYFIALELILMAGHGAILLGIGTVSQIVLPILLCVQLLTYYLLSGQLNNIFLFIGIIGTALLSIGFSYTNQWIFFLGSLAVAIYSFFKVHQGIRIAFLWGALNTVFVVVALYKLFGATYG